jgi:hypothetical protein
MAYEWPEGNLVLNLAAENDRLKHFRENALHKGNLNTVD